MSDDLEDGIRGKLVAVKQAWARAGRLLTGNPDPDHDMRLPPGQRLVTNWPVLDLGIQPDVPKSEWRLTVDGLVANPIDWSWSRASSRSRSSRTHPTSTASPNGRAMTTAGKASRRRTSCRWCGPCRPRPLSFSMAMTVTPPTSGSIILPKTTACSLTRTTARPFRREHGGPVRAILPRWYLWKSAKWLKRIEILPADAPGFWEVRGYHNEGDPWTEQRYG